MLASLLINLLGMLVPLFVMQTYDRVVPNQATSTLWVLTIGLLIGTGFDLLLRVLRAHLLDTAGRRPTWCSRPPCSNASPACR